MSLQSLRPTVHFGSAWREQLNPAQRAAATHTGGPLLIVAGAGTGKTMTLGCRVAHLIESGTPAQRLLLLTFSRRAAREMLSRTQAIVGPEQPQRVWSGTFHAVATRLLRTHGRLAGVEPGFSVLDQADASDMFNLIRAELHGDRKRRRFPRKETLSAIYSRTVNAQTPLRDVLESDFPWCIDDERDIADIFTHYTQRKRETMLFDYDDLLLYWRALMEGRGGEMISSQFDEVMVDEYQDTNSIQADIVCRFRAFIDQITVVGDDAQAIYSFRAATVSNILNFEQMVGGATVIRLEQNYRSTPSILAASNAAIELSPQRHEKTLFSTRPAGASPTLVTCQDEMQQAHAICDSILEFRERGVPLMEQAVLFRTGHHSDVLEVELTRRNIPFIKYGGLKFLEAAHVKDVVALLRLLENPHDQVSWHRVLLLLDGVGPAHARRLMQEFGVGQGMSLPTPLARFLDASPEQLRPNATAGAELQTALADCSGDIPLAVQVERLRAFCTPIFQRIYANSDSRLRDIEQLQLLAGNASSRAAFLTDMALDPPSSTADLAGPPHLDEDFVILSTIHSAKGGEWDVVRVLHAADGMIPSDMSTGSAESIEEERRLFYVALTRARDVLEVYFPQRYYSQPRGVSDRFGYAQLTRFIPDSVRRHFAERVLTAATADDAPGHDVELHGTAEVDRLLAKLW